MSACRERVEICGRGVGVGEPMWITAECAAAHGGNPDWALRLVDAAHAAGCDAVEFFFAHPDEFYHQEDAARRQPWRTYWMPPETWQRIAEHAHALGIPLYWTPLDVKSVDLCESLGAPLYNLNSCDINNPLMQERVAATGKPVTFHDIGATLGEVEAAVERLRRFGAPIVIPLHSTEETQDPDRMLETMNLCTVDTYRAAFGRPIGMVEHTRSLLNPIVAAAYQVDFLSKHLVLDRASRPSDWQISVEPEEMRQVVAQVRAVERCFGARRNVDAQMREGTRLRRKCLVSRVAIAPGTRLSRENLTAKRSQRDWIPADQIDQLTRFRARVPIPADVPIRWEYLEPI